VHAANTVVADRAPRAVGARLSRRQTANTRRAALSIRVVKGSRSASRQSRLSRKSAPPARAKLALRSK
jgi:hypothetical protein